MPRTMLSNKFYRNIEKNHGERGKYILSRISPLIERLIFSGGVAFISGYVLDKHRKNNESDLEGSLSD